MWIYHVSRVNVSCLTCECVMSHMWMCHVSHVNASCLHLSTPRLTCVMRSYVWLDPMVWHFDMCMRHVLHIDVLRLTCECVMSHMWMCHVTCYIQMHYVSHVNVSCLTCECVMSRITYRCTTSHMWMCHVSHVNVSCHVLHIDALRLTCE